MRRAPGKRRVAALAGCLAALALAACCVWYVADYSRAQAQAVEAMGRASVVGDEYCFGDESSETGLILYPGGKVEHTAYAPLAESIARAAGILCVVPDMPLNLAVLDSSAAEAITARYDGVKRWYIGGHSLGGAMAASYAAKGGREFEGVVLLAAYPTDELSIPVLSVYGSLDTVLDSDKYVRGTALASDLTELVIPGGNHAQFGDYGEQKGDGAASITASRQQSITAEAVAEWLRKAA